MTDTPIIVIGAGIVGVSTAIWLQRAGCRVTLMDAEHPGAGASFGNAGLLAAWSVDPVTSPGLWKDLPEYLIKSESPLFLQWSALHRTLPWLARFMSYATDAKTRAIVSHLTPLVLDAVDQHRALVAGTPAENWVRDSSCGIAYPDRAAFDADHYSWQLKADVGLIPDVLTGPAVQEAEPILGPATGCLAVLSGQGHITDPGRYIALLAQHFTDSGGTVVKARVQDIHRHDGRVTHLDSDQGRFDCDRVVITAGIWSKALMQKLGLHVPLQAERGYHIVFESPSQMPRNPLLMTKGKFGVNPMDMGLRCAGTLELGDHDAGPSAAPLRFIRKQVATCFPDLRYSGTREWVGSRPTTPDSTPLIGQIGDSGIFTGFGHQHIGLTTGPKTGRLLAQMISGQMPNLHMAPYAPERFSR